MSWTHAFLDRLVRGANPDGSWGYRPHTTGCSEPTALASLALAVHPAAQSSDALTVASRAGLNWLTDLQKHDGSVPVAHGLPSPHWPTAMAVLAWAGCDDADSLTKNEACTAAVRWLLNTRGLAIEHDAHTFGHDTTLQGWPWVADTHSWAEPTAMAIAALKKMGHSDHPRVREGCRLLLDRCLPNGGWNYGNTRVLANTLRPFPATTGIVLAALAGEPETDKTALRSRVDASVAYLTDALKRVRAPLSLAWGLIGLGTWDARPPESHDWLAECAERSRDEPGEVAHDALLLLADARWRPAGKCIGVSADG